MKSISKILLLALSLLFFISCDSGNGGSQTESNTDYRVSSYGGEVYLPISSGAVVASIVSLPDWLTLADQENLKFTAPENWGEERSGEIIFKVTGSDEELKVTVAQDAHDMEPEWLDKQITKTNVIIRFTGSWCVYCPTLTRAIAKADEEIESGNMIVYAVNEEYSNTTHPLHYNSSTYLQNYYFVSGFPTGIIDGRMVLKNYGTEVQIAKICEEMVEETNKLHPATINAAISSDVVNEKIKLQVALNVKNPGNYKIVALMTENNLVSSQKDIDGEKADYVHNSVLREFFTAHTGDVFNAFGTGTFYRDFMIDIPEKIQDLANCDIIVYVLTQTGELTTEVFVPNETTDDILLQKGEVVDNAFKAKLGERVDFKY